MPNSRENFCIQIVDVHLMAFSTVKLVCMGFYEGTPSDLMYMYIEMKWGYFCDN